MLWIWMQLRWGFQKIGRKRPYTNRDIWDGLKFNLRITHNPHHARKLLEDIKAGKCQFHAIEIMVLYRGRYC